MPSHDKITQFIGIWKQQVKFSVNIAHLQTMHIFVKYICLETFRPQEKQST
jgi:hypothetical protein